MKAAQVEFAGFKLHGFKCSCGEESLSPADVELVRRLKNEPLRARRVAHSLVITLPKPLAEIANIREGDKLNWTISGNQLTVQKRV